MHVLTIIGLVLQGGTIVTDRFIHPLSNSLAILLYLIAVIMIVAGMVLGKKNSRNQSSDGTRG